MQVFCLFIIFLFANDLADATRVPENCGAASDEFTLNPFSYTNQQEQNDVLWAADYHGLMFVSKFPYRRDKVKWTVKYKTRTNSQEDTFHSVFEDFTFGIAELWKNQDDKSHPIFETNLRPVAGITGYGKAVTTNLFIKPGSEVLEMRLIFSTDTGSCKIKNIKFQDCSVDRPLVVNSINSKFSSNGQFTCENGFDIIPLDPDIETTCLANTEWKDASKFKCYTAPNDTHIVGNLMIKENEKMEIYCKFTQTTPVAYTSMFSFGGEISELPLNEPYARDVTIDDDGKEIWCQPISSYTEIEQFSDKGKSPLRQLRVLFSPKSEATQNKNATRACDWTIGRQNSCIFTFLSRPPADIVNLFLIKNGKTTNNLAWVRMKYVSSTSQDLQTITITDIERDELSSQTFQLDVKSSEFPNDNFTIQFDLNVTKINSTSTQQNHALIYIGVGVLIAVLICVLGLVIRCRRRKKLDNNNGEFVKEDRFNVIYDANEFGQDQVNPIYHAHKEDTMEEIRVGTYEVLTEPSQTSNETSYGEYDMAGDGTDAVYENYDANLNKDHVKSYQSMNDQPQLYATVNKEKKKNLSQDSTQLYAQVNKRNK